MDTIRPSADHAWCDAALSRVSRTFALNIRLLPGRLRTAAGVGYLLCRAADALEDSWPGDAGQVRSRFALLLAALGDGDAGAAAETLADDARSVARGRADLELVASLPRVRRAWRTLPEPDRGLVAECVRTLAGGMCRYAARSADRPPGTPYLDTEEELSDYCWVVAGCVGVMLTSLFAAHEAGTDAAVAGRRLALAPVVGEALQLTNILLDWPQDVRRGRCYLPASWLAEHGLGTADLVSGPSAAVDRLTARLEGKARAALARVPDYLELLPPGARRYRWFTLLPALWGLASLEHARRDPEFPWGAHRPRLPRARLWAEALGGLTGHRGTALRRLRAAVR
jgi:farnesyl-diphosphate farnesyltransferase